MLGLIMLVLSWNEATFTQWMSLAHTEETVGEFMNRTSGGSLLNLDDMDETSSVQGDEIGLLSSKVVDVPRFELGASTMPR